MVIDSSAIVGLLLGEPEADAFVRAIASTSRRLMSAATYVEVAIVMLGRYGPAAIEKLDRFLNELAVSIMPVTRAQADLAISAYQRYGRGSRHPAGLNFGDCFSYALAAQLGEPLLFKGEDFSHTDIENALGGQAGTR